MGDKIFNAFIAALFGTVAGIGSVWYLSAPGNITKDPSLESPQRRGLVTQQKEIDALSVRNLTVTDRLTVCDPESGETLIELRDGSILAQKEVLADTLGGYRLAGQRIQITSEDPANEESAICGEFASNENGGAYLALLSPLGTHSINFGFDRQETGFILSQNNQDATMLAQVVLPIPQKNDTEPSADETLPTAADNFSPSGAENEKTVPPLSEATSFSIAPASEDNSIPDFLPPSLPF